MVISINTTLNGAIEIIFDDENDDEVSHSFAATDITAAITIINILLID